MLLVNLKGMSCLQFYISQSDSYSRTCDSANNCGEEYQNCRTEITDARFLVEKATGLPAKVGILMA